MNPGSPPPSSLSLEVFRSFEEALSIEGEWNSLAAKCGCEIYQSFDWCRVWWKHYGVDRDLRILAFRSMNGSLSGLHPFFVEEIGLGPSRARVAKQVASDYTMGTMRPVVIAEDLIPVMEMTHRYFLHENACDGLRWGVLDENQPIVTAIDAISISSGEPPLEVFRVSHGIESVLQLPDTFQDYLKSLSKNHRTNFKRSWNRLVRELDFSVDLVEGEDFTAQMLEEFIQLHRSQWEAVGESGHFGDWPRALEFHREMAEVESKRGNLFLVRGRVGEELVSAQYGYRFGDRLTWLLPARKMEESWSKYGLGRVGFVVMVRLAIENGCRKIHLGGAYWQYKSDLGGIEEETLSLVVAPKGRSSRRVRRLLALFRIFDAFYYKIWFTRVAPRLPWRRGKLWDTWIRWKL